MGQGDTKVIISKLKEAGVNIDSINPELAAEIFLVGVRDGIIYMIREIGQIKGGLELLESVRLKQLDIKRGKYEQ